MEKLSIEKYFIILLEERRRQNDIERHAVARWWNEEKAISLYPISLHVYQKRKLFCYYHWLTNQFISI